MNEQIEKLAEQAGLEYNFDPMLWLNYEKFAELIVRECVSVCEGQATFDPQTLPYKPSKQFADAIKQHFGIKQ